MTGQYHGYRITDAAGVAAYIAVIQDTAAGDCKKPGAANASKVVGITQQAQAVQNKTVNVKERGVSFAIAAGAIAVGDYVNVADVNGKLQSCQATVDAAPGAAAVTNVVGRARTAATNDGDIFEVDVQPFAVKTAAS